ncbi:hypothetical protein HN450_03835 [bacterium]|jgi:hypothetical protein|nr:hypothetical protein [bacterium]MBT3849925.1 hypothetical protein [bacterium]MBT4435830.1 hypothetical protein [bacterium]MDG2445375.1 hypothetical protein [Thermodesulfobacteriota bacterium]|tara:strand:+ start:92 stop:418 length:327 start_codon:yes stop_codon:yes gene_type:complete
MNLDIKSPSTFITKVSTLSKSNEFKSVKLKVVYKDGFFYLTRRNKNSAWYKNLLNSEIAKIIIEDTIYDALATEITDEKERLQVSNIKYNDERRHDIRYGFKLQIKGE